MTVIKIIVQHLLLNVNYYLCNKVLTERPVRPVFPDYLSVSHDYDEDKPFILINIPFCDKNENKSKDFVKKFNHFTNGKYCISISWITKKV